MKNIIHEYKIRTYKTRTVVLTSCTPSTPYETHNVALERLVRIIGTYRDEESLVLMTCTYSTVNKKNE